MLRLVLLRLLVLPLLRLLVLRITRYENGGEEGLLSAFRQLSGYGDVLEGLNRLDDASLLKLLRENPFTQASQQDVFSERLASLAQYALRGECGSQVQEAFQEIIRAILINESVYMPLRHGLLPMEWDGKMSYGEFWVDPDAQDEEKRSEAGKNQEGKIQFLFKMDIQNLGFLEMALGAIPSRRSDRPGYTGDSEEPWPGWEEHPGDQGGEASGHHRCVSPPV